MDKKLPTIEELNRMAFSDGKGFTRAVLESWGVPWPPKSGWAKKLRIEILTKAGDQIANQPSRKKAKKKLKVSVPRQSKPYAPTPNDPKNPKSFYASWEWKKKRMEALLKHGHRCQSCGASPSNLQSVRLVVDHIKPIRKHWNLRLDLRNLQVLCDDCNMGKGAWLEMDFRPEEQAVDEDYMTAQFREMMRFN